MFHVPCSRRRRSIGGHKHVEACETRQLLSAIAVPDVVIFGQNANDVVFSPLANDITDYAVWGFTDQPSLGSVGIEGNMDSSGNDLLRYTLTLPTRTSSEKDTAISAVNAEITNWRDHESTNVDIRYARTKDALDMLKDFIERRLANDQDWWTGRTANFVASAASGTIGRLAFVTEEALNLAEEALKSAAKALLDMKLPGEAQTMENFLTKAKASMHSAWETSRMEIDEQAAQMRESFNQFLAGLGNPEVLQNDVFQYAIMDSSSYGSSSYSTTTITIDFQGRQNFYNIVSNVEAYSNSLQPRYSSDAPEAKQIAGQMIREIGKQLGLTVRSTSDYWQNQGMPTWEAVSGSTDWPDPDHWWWPDWDWVSFGLDATDIADELNLIDFEDY